MKKKKLIKNMSSRNMNKAGITRKLFKINETWEEYVFRKPIVRAKKADCDILINDVDQEVICRQGDYIVWHLDGYHVYKKEDFEPNFKETRTREYDLVNLAIENMATILPNKYEITQEIPLTFLNRLKLLFHRGNIKVSLKRERDIWGSGYSLKLTAETKNDV